MPTVTFLRVRTYIKLQRMSNLRTHAVSFEIPQGYHYCQTVTYSDFLTALNLKFVIAWTQTVIFKNWPENSVASGYGFCRLL